MRSLTATLSLVLLIMASFGCKKKEEAQNQPPAANQTATTTTAPADNTAAPAPGTPPAATTQQSETTPPPSQPAATQPSTTQPSATQPVATQPGTTPAPAKPTILASQKILMRPGFLALADRDSVAGTWRGTLSKSHSQLIFHFDANGWGSLDAPQQNIHIPVSISKYGDTVEINLTSSTDKFYGKIKDRKMTGAWVQRTSSEELELSKD